jgi:hypothetical protein
MTSLIYVTGACENTLERPSEQTRTIHTPRAFHARIWDDERNSKYDVSLVRCSLHCTIPSRTNCAVCFVLDSLLGVQNGLEKVPICNC